MVSFNPSYVPPMPLKRWSSSGHLEKLSNAQKEIAQRSSVIWVCIARIPNRDGGYLYQFKLRDKFDYITDYSTISTEELKSKVEEMYQTKRLIYPALETCGLEALHLSSLLKFEEYLTFLSLFCALNYIQQNKKYDYEINTIEKIKKILLQSEFFFDNGVSLYKTAMVLNELGLNAQRKDDGVYLSLPDREAFLVRWENFRCANPQMPEFKIKESEGIAGHEEFILAYLQNDLLLSKGKEFIHDIIIHLISRLKLIFDSPEKYLSEKDRINLLILKKFQRLLLVEEEIKKGTLSSEEVVELKKHLEKFRAALSAFTDYTMTIETFQGLEKITSEVSENFEEEVFKKSEAWLRYMEGQFGPINWEEEISPVHEYLNMIVADILEKSKKTHP